jgi:hypothetical protein
MPRITDAQTVRALIAALGLPRVEVAAKLGCGERILRYYCAGTQRVPRMVILALERLIDLQARKR